MKYALNLSENGRILSATYAKFAAEDMTFVEGIPQENISDYRYVEGKYIFDPAGDSEVEDAPTRLDALEAQAAYTAMMTDTLLEV